MKCRQLSVALLCAAGLVSIGACSWLGQSRDDLLGETLADLQPARLPDPELPMPAVDIDDIEASYRRAMESAESDALRRQILIRLAGLEMLRSEQQQVEATAAGRFFDMTVSMYEELIDLQEGRPGRDKLLYQLAKAYALDGRGDESAQVLDQLAREYPQSPYMAEAQFRRAERAFSKGDYRAAQAYYADVVAQGDATPFLDNARYMQGWAQFKTNDYSAALTTFTGLLDEAVAEHGELDNLQSSARSMVDDTLRVMSLIFSYQDGAQSIAQAYETLGPRQYEHLLYRALGDLYLEKERYRDSADTYAHYVRNNPHSEVAPDFSVGIIDVYERGNFPTLILPAKQDFVRAYGINSSYWEQVPEQHEKLRGYLHPYLQELASYSHSRAQDLKQEGERGYRQHFSQAAEWYQHFLATFPEDEKTAEMLFLLGESRFEAGELAAAIAAYERVAFELVDSRFGADAAYAAILTADQLMPSLDAEGARRYREQRINNALSLADYYPNDDRASAVLGRAAQDLLSDGKLAQAVAAAERLSAWQRPLDPALRLSAWLIQGQGRFDLQHYEKAEFAYREALALMPSERSATTEGPGRNEVVERIAASMFKQAEDKLAAGNKADAVEQLLRISRFAPESEIAISADYDAATYMIELQRWQEAEQQLLAFRRRYPDHHLNASIPAKLVAVYQAQENWQAAAGELRHLAASGDDPEVRRQSLIMSAELFERGGDLSRAISAYRDYANNYAQPFAETLEAANKLALLYGSTGDAGRRGFWLNKIIALDADAGSERSDRSRYLAAAASSELADQRYQAFASIALSLPLKQSLDRKRKAMEETLDAYESILDYGIAEFSTQANYRIGDVYVQISRALLESERPRELNALELEQYQILLEEQAYPFEERAIEILEANARRSWGGLYDDWVRQSFDRLATLLPARYGKHEQVMDYSHAIQ